MLLIEFRLLLLFLFSWKSSHIFPLNVDVQEAIDYLTWTYYFRRLLMNPTYYGLESADDGAVNRFLSKLSLIHI